MFSILLGATLGIGLAFLMLVAALSFGDVMANRYGWNADLTAVGVMGAALVASASILLVLL